MKTLKLMTILLCLVSAVAVTSCKKDASELIVGKWKVVHSYEYTTSNPDRHLYEDSAVGDTYEFTDDGNVIWTSSGGDERQSYPFSISENTITVAFFSGGVEECTNTSLIFYLDNGFDGDWNQRTHYECERVD